ncbi:MAG: hypothetical protein ACREX8_14615, partial [Gammaproteobacteria bacterium]
VGHAKGASAVRHPKVQEPAPTGAGPAIDVFEEAIALDQDDAPQTELARLLLAARREYLAIEGRFLDGHELDRELAERRGGAAVADEG